MTRRRDLLALAGGLAGAGLAGCVDSLSPGGTEEIPTLVPESTPDGTPVATATASELGRLVAGNTAFALDLHRRLADASEGNAMASPYSVSTALAMTYAGARGRTAEEMARTLRFDLSRERLHPVVAALDGRVDPDTPSERAPTATPHERNDVPFTVETVNALWGQAGYPFADGFLHTLATHYGTGLRTLDFEAEPDRSRRRINRWVAGRTDDRITDLLPEGSVTPLTRFVLTNAVYFLSNWASTFEREATEQREFTALDGTTSRVATMFQRHGYPFAAVDGYRVVELPYENREFGMVIVLPPEGQFRETERSLDAGRLTRLFDALSEREGALYLPRFTVETGLDLSAALSTLGMPSAFSPDTADFSGVVEPSGRPDLFLQGVHHRTVLEVAEWGTEAAAATGAVGGGGGAPDDPFEMHVDRPFLFCIRHRPTGVVLFLGRVVDAAAAQ